MAVAGTVLLTIKRNIPINQFIISGNSDKKIRIKINYHEILFIF